MNEREVNGSEQSKDRDGGDEVTQGWVSSGECREGAGRWNHTELRLFLSFARSLCEWPEHSKMSIIITLIMAVLVSEIADFRILHLLKAYSTVGSAFCKWPYWILKQALEMSLVITSILQMNKQNRE